MVISVHWGVLFMQTYGNSLWLILLPTFVANTVIPDHDAGVFNPPVTGTERFTLVDKIIFIIFGGFRRWDAIYFLHIAQHGYTYENCVAFFPLYPMLISSTARLFSLCPFISETSLLLLSGVVINTVVFVAAAVLLFRLGQLVTQDDQTAYNAAVLFCINPASIFMTAPYTEVLFACLSFGVMLCVKEQRLLGAAILTAASALTRSNGLVSAGFILHHIAVKYFAVLTSMYRVHKNRKVFLITSVMCETITQGLIAMFLLSVSIIPFICYQWYIYELFCFPENQAERKLFIESSVINYGCKEGYRLVGDHPVSPWCFHSVPLSYSYIQSHHWGVGFLSYYQVKQIPNFVLAAPIITLSLCACYSFYFKQPAACRTLGLFEKEKLKVETVGSHVVENRNGWENPKLVVYILHLLFLTLFGCFFMHIQVLTRFLCSASPVIYWFAAYLIHNQNSLSSCGFAESLESPSLSTFLTLYKDTTAQGKWVLVFFLGYFVIGTVAFSNFLPWT